MLLTTYQGARDFLLQTEQELLKQEVVHSLMLGICIRLRDHPDSVVQSPYLATVEDERGLLCAACMTPPRNLILHSWRDAPLVAFELVLKNLFDQGPTLPGVLAPEREALTFAQSWQRLSGRPYREGIREQVFALRQVQFPQPAPGRMRVARMSDVALIAQWLEAFVHEALAGQDASDAYEVAMTKIQHGDMYVWELPDKQVVSMAGKTRPIINVISVGPVYTPPEQRGKGYAANCVAALSQHLLDSGWRACSLFADMANPTSNSIYQKMGYRPLATYAEYLFEPR